MINEVPILQTTHSGTMMALLHWKQKAYAKCTTLPTKYNTSCTKCLTCFPNFVSVEGHTDWITVTILMCELWVPVTSCSGYNHLNENQTTPLISEAICWGHNDLMWLPKEPPPLKNCFIFGSTLVIFHPSGWAQSRTTSTPILHPIPGHALLSTGRTGTRSLSLL